jgi:hypothetical protein
MDQLYQSRILLVVSMCMSPTRLGYRALGLKLVSLENNQSRQPKRPPMVEENRDAGEEDYIQLLLEEALT